MLGCVWAANTAGAQQQSPGAAALLPTINTAQAARSWWGGTGTWGGALGAWGNGASPLPQHHGLLCTAAVHWKEGGRVVSPHSRALRGWELEGRGGGWGSFTPPPAVQWGQMGVVGWSRLLAAVWGGTEDSDPPLPSPAPLTGLHLLHSL